MSTAPADRRPRHGSRARLCAGARRSLAARLFAGGTVSFDTSRSARARAVVCDTIGRAGGEGWTAGEWTAGRGNAPAQWRSN